MNVYAYGLDKKGFTLFRGLVFCIALMLQACGTTETAAPSSPQLANFPTELPSTSVVITNTKGIEATVLSRTAEPSPIQQDTVTGVPTPHPVSHQDSTALRWLQNQPCSAPCWEGITPGKTTLDMALTLLQTNKLVANVTQVWRDRDRGIGQIHWKWLAGGYGSVYFDANQQPPRIISIEMSPYFSFTLDQVIKAFGTPSHVLATTSPAPDGSFFYNLRFLYLSKGFVLFSIIDQNTKPIIKKDTLVYYPFFFEANSSGYATAIVGGKRDLEDAVSWEGFKDFDYYCQKSLSCRVLKAPPISPNVFVGTP